MFDDLIVYEDIQEACEEYFGFSGVVFKRDFGPFKQGQRVDTIWFDLTKSCVEAFDDKQSVLGKVKFQLSVISE